MNRYRNAKIIVIASDVRSQGGDWRSIYFLIQHLEMLGESAPLINLGCKRSLRQLLAALVFGRKIVMNGLGTAMRLPILLACLVRTDIAIYLHETEYMLENARKSNPLKYRILKKILRRNPLLCVSKQAEKLYRQRFGTTHTHVVYECSGAKSKEIHFDPAKTHIVMVGSINERKGAELFSKVADLAVESHPEWQFHWVGGMATMNPIYRSDRVTWHGWQQTPENIVVRCDVFFLSSIDDPCPLAALEAGNEGKRIVTFQKTGTAEIIDGLPGCRVFNTYSAEAAMNSIEKALGDGAEIEQPIREAIRSFSSVEAFAANMDQALNEHFQN